MVAAGGAVGGTANQESRELHEKRMASTGFIVLEPNGVGVGERRKEDASRFPESLMMAPPLANSATQAYDADSRLT